MMYTMFQKKDRCYIFIGSLQQISSDIKMASYVVSKPSMTLRCICTFVRYGILNK